MEQRLIKMLHVNRVREPHINLDSFTFHPVSQRLSSKFHTSGNIVYNKICHKYIHIMAWKDQKRKQRQPVGSLFLLNSCCEQAAAGMLRAFPVHFVPLQSNSTQPNIHNSCADTKNCMKYGFSYETDFLGKLLTHFSEINLKSV